MDHLWWADQSGFIGTLNPAIDSVTVFTIPFGTKPEMVTWSDTAIWYTDDVSGTLGLMYPSAAGNYSFTAATSVMTTTPDCFTVISVYAARPSVATGTLAWSSNVITETVSAGGWQVYQMPAGAKPWGIAAQDDSIFVTDNGRNKLTWLNTFSRYFPLIFR